MSLTLLRTHDILPFIGSHWICCLFYDEPCRDELCTPEQMRSNTHSPHWVHILSIVSNSLSFFLSLSFRSSSDELFSRANPSASWHADRQFIWFLLLPLAPRSDKSNFKREREREKHNGVNILQSEMHLFFCSEFPPTPRSLRLQINSTACSAKRLNVTISPLLIRLVIRLCACKENNETRVNEEGEERRRGEEEEEEEEERRRRGRFDYCWPRWWPPPQVDIR